MTDPVEFHDSPVTWSWYEIMNIVMFNTNDIYARNTTDMDCRGEGLVGLYPYTFFLFPY